MAQGYNQALAGMSGTLGQFVVCRRGEASVLRRRVFTVAGPGTAGQKRGRAAVAALADAWGALDPARRVGWMSLGAQMTGAGDGPEARALSGYQCFVAVNSGREALGLAFLADAPAAPSPPRPLPALTLDISGGGGVMTLGCGASGYESAVQVLASRPRLPGGPAARVKDFVRIAVLPGIGPGGAGIGTPYASRWGVPAPGLAVTVRVVPLSPAGFRGYAASATGLCAAGG